MAVTVNFVQPYLSYKYETTEALSLPSNLKMLFLKKNHKFNNKSQPLLEICFIQILIIILRCVVEFLKDDYRRTKQIMIHNE